MPGFVLHLMHGLFITSKNKIHFSERERVQFQMGLLMPDANKVCKRRNDQSHFYTDEDNEKILKFPNLEAFPYLYLLNNPFVLGYAAHLYLDKLFFEEYFLEYVRFLDERGQETINTNSIKKAYLVNSNQYISVLELFSEKYLYGDYTLLNHYFVDKYSIKPIEETECDNPISEVRITDFAQVSQSLTKYLSESTGRADTKVFTVESLESAIERYAFGFTQWINGINASMRESNDS